MTAAAADAPMSGLRVVDFSPPGRGPLGDAADG